MFYFLDLEIIYYKKIYWCFFFLKNNLFLNLAVSEALILEIDYIAFIHAYINGVISVLEYTEETGIQPRL